MTHRLWLQFACSHHNASQSQSQQVSLCRKGEVCALMRHAGLKHWDRLPTRRLCLQLACGMRVHANTSHSLFAQVIFYRRIA